MTGGCPRVEQAVGLVLHALEPAEEVDVLRHLPTCEECRATVRDAESVLSGIGDAVEQVDPPARLRSGIIDAAGRTPQLSASQPPTSSRPPTAGRSGEPRPATAQPGSTTGSTAGSRPPAESPQPSADRRPAAPSHGSSGPGRTSRRHRTGRWLAAAALALVAVLGIGGLTARTVQLQGERDAQAAQTQTLLEMAMQFDQPGTRHAWLAAAPDTTPVAAVMVNGPTQQLLAVGLPANTASRDTYVLWGTGAGAPRALDTFDVGSGQSGPHTVDSAAEAGNFPGYAISIEPGRTAPASPSTVVASGQVEL